MNKLNDEQIAELLVGDVSDIEELNEDDKDDNLDEFYNVVEQNFHDEEVIYFSFFFFVNKVKSDES